MGQRVTEGQVLLTLDAATIDLQLRQAKAALGEATSALDGAREDADRRQPSSRGRGRTGGAGPRQSRGSNRHMPVWNKRGGRST